MSRAAVSSVPGTMRLASMNSATSLKVASPKRSSRMESASSSVAEAGRQQQAFVELVATTTGWLIALLPLVLLTLVWLVPRIRFAVRSRRLRGMFAAGMTADTLAVRALSRAPLRELVAVHPDPASVWRSNDPVLVRRLAEVELRRAGIRASALP